MSWSGKSVWYYNYLSLANTERVGEEIAGMRVWGRQWNSEQWAVGSGSTALPKIKNFSEPR